MAQPLALWSLHSSGEGEQGEATATTCDEGSDKHVLGLLLRGLGKASAQG